MIAKRKIILASLTLVFVAIVFLPLFAIGADDAKDTTDPRAADLGGYVKAIFNFGIYALAIASFATLVLGGYFYMFSFGRPTIKRKAVEFITNSIVGLVVGLTSYLLLNTIDANIWGGLNKSSLITPYSNYSQVNLGEGTDCLKEGHDPFTGETITVPDFNCGRSSEGDDKSASK